MNGRPDRQPRAIEPRGFAELESVIGRGMQTFIEVGEALKEIRDRRLYRDVGYKSFDTYCRERWGWTASRARQLCIATETVTTVTAHGLSAPTTERQARELARIPEGRRVEVWKAAQAEAASKGKLVTASQLYRMRTAKIDDGRTKEQIAESVKVTQAIGAFRHAIDEIEKVREQYTPEEFVGIVEHWEAEAIARRLRPSPRRWLDAVADAWEETYGEIDA